MTQLLLVAGKASLLLLVVLGSVPLLRRASARTRHRVWTTLFAALLGLPVLSVTLPELHVPVSVASEATTPLQHAVSPTAMRAGAVVNPGPAEETGSGLRIETTGEKASRAASPHDTAPSAGRQWLITWSKLPLTLVLVWLIGAIWALAAIAVSQFRVRRLERTADVVGDPSWRSAAATIGSRLGLRRPARIFMSAGVGTPMAGGFWRPAILLPASASTWSPEWRDVVLAHEIVHLAWRDPLRHLATRLVLALYWFHPLAWIAAGQAIVAREEACDEAVLSLGTRRSDYARVLLDLADTAGSPAVTTAALPMVQRLHLETRLMTILNADLRPASRLRFLVPIFLVVLLTVVAAAQPMPLVQPPESAKMPRPADANVALAAAAVTTSPAPQRSSVQRPSAQPPAAADTACNWNAHTAGSFSGSISITENGQIREQIGRRSDDLVIQKSFGDLRVCMVAEGVSEHDHPSGLIGKARRIVLEARSGSGSQRLELRQGDNSPAWQVGGKARTFDAAAHQWRDRMLALLDTTWEAATLRGQVSSLHGEISSIHGQRSSLQGEISTLQGQVSSIKGEISSVRGHESSLNGEISSIQGHLSSLRGAISSEQGAMSSLNASRYGASDAERSRIAGRIAEHEARIRKIEAEIKQYDADARIRAVQRERIAYDAQGKIDALEARIRTFDLNGKVADVERRIKELDVEGKVAAIETQIKKLDADRRIAQLEARQRTELERVKEAIAAIG